MATPSPLNDHPLAALSREDLDMVAELVLQSGSLKGLAAAYGVSYPTIRLRFDRVIERLKAARLTRKGDPVAHLLADLIEKNELSPAGARSILAAVRQASKEGD